MTHRPFAGLIAVGAFALFGAAAAQDSAPPRAGYLAPGAAPDMLKVLPPPPAAGSKREAADRAVFRATRALAGQPRWSLATTDANLAQGSDFFSCAIGARIDATHAPVLAGIFRKVAMDTGAVTDPPKTRYGRRRPYSAPDAASAPVCVPKSEALTKNASYPSGHASLSWSWGLVVAELAPDRAGEVLARARSIGESRVVCGVHYPSDIEAGRMSGTALIAALHADPAFRTDMERARAELAALRGGPHEAPSNCAVQDDAALHPPY